MIDEEKIKVTLYFSPEDHQRLKIEAATRKMTMSEIVIEALNNRVRKIVDFPRT